MGNGFDFGVERLMGKGCAWMREQTTSEGSPSKMPTQEQGTDLKIGHYKIPTVGTFYLETFGCQMNEHDSEKVAGVLLARGYRQVETGRTRRA